MRPSKLASDKILSVDSILFIKKWGRPAIQQCKAVFWRVLDMEWTGYKIAGYSDLVLRRLQDIFMI